MCSGDSDAVVDAHSSGFEHVATEKSYVEAFKDANIVANIGNQPSMFRFEDGSTVPIDWKFKEVYRDEYAAEALPEASIRAAIVDEMT